MLQSLHSCPFFDTNCPGVIVEVHFLNFSNEFSNEVQKSTNAFVYNGKKRFC